MSRPDFSPLMRAQRSARDAGMRVQRSVDSARRATVEAQRSARYTVLDSAPVSYTRSALSWIANSTPVYYLTRGLSRAVKSTPGIYIRETLKSAVKATLTTSGLVWGSRLIYSHIGDDKALTTTERKFFIGSAVPLLLLNQLFITRESIIASRELRQIQTRALKLKTIHELQKALITAFAKPNNAIQIQHLAFLLDDSTHNLSLETEFVETQFLKFRRRNLSRAKYFLGDLFGGALSIIATIVLNASEFGQLTYNDNLLHVKDNLIVYGIGGSMALTYMILTCLDGNPEYKSIMSANAVVQKRLTKILEKNVSLKEIYATHQGTFKTPDFVTKYEGKLPVHSDVKIVPIDDEEAFAELEEMRSGKDEAEALGPTISPAALGPSPTTVK